MKLGGGMFLMQVHNTPLPQHHLRAPSQDRNFLNNRLSIIYFMKTVKILMIALLTVMAVNKVVAQNGVGQKPPDY
jgi:hypothetical protein